METQKLVIFYAIATNPVRAVTNKVTHIVGDRDMLAPMESEYRSTGINYKTSLWWPYFHVF